MTNYSRWINDVASCYNPESDSMLNYRMFSSLADADRDAAKFVKLAMSPVDDSYTQRSKQAGNNVRDWLKSKQTNVDYAFQGSVMTNTHIKGYSDIDLLTLCDKFYGTEIDKVRNILQQAYNGYTWGDEEKLRTFDRNFTHYTGSGLQDLRDLRKENETLLAQRYVICDTTKAKAIRIKNQNLNMDVDVVTASKHQSIRHILHDYDNAYLGVCIYDKVKDCQLDADYPFLRIQLMNQRGLDTGDRFKKMIRFLKNLRSQSAKGINLTSFEINSICYDIPTCKYSSDYYLQLVNVLYEKMALLCNNSIEADKLKSVDGTEYVFRNKTEKVQQLKALTAEVKHVLDDLQSNNNNRIIY